MLTLKAFDDDSRPELATALLTAVAERPDLAVEIGDYQGTGFRANPAALDLLRALPPARKSMHLNHGAYCLVDLLQEDWARSGLEREMVCLGVKRTLPYGFLNGAT